MSACCSERNVREGVKKSMGWMATSLVLVALFGFVVLWLVCAQKLKEHDRNTVVSVLKF